MLADLTLELEEAQQMQIALLPESAPNISSLEIAGRNIGAKEVGGDFFDYLTKGENQILIAVGDVSGKGLKGAMNAVMASGILNLSAEHQDTAVEIMSEVNKSLCQSTEARHERHYGLGPISLRTKADDLGQCWTTRLSIVETRHFS